MLDARGLRPVPMDVTAGDGVRLRLWDYGGNGAPLLLCHCAGTLGRIWDPVIARLPGGIRPLALDLRGHGDSDKPRGQRHYRWECFGADVAAVVDALNLAGCAAAGHSGGAVAVTLAQLERPGLFRRIALVDAVLATEKFFPVINPMADQARRRRAHFESRDAVRHRLGAKFPFNTWTGEAFEAYVAHGFDDLPDGTVHLKCPPSVEAHFYETGPSEHVLERLHEIDVPALLVSGARSYLLEYVHEQQRRLPRGRCEVLADTGHFIPQERPGETAALLAEWLG